MKRYMNKKIIKPDLLKNGKIQDITRYNWEESQKELEGVLREMRRVRQSRQSEIRKEQLNNKWGM